MKNFPFNQEWLCYDFAAIKRRFHGHKTISWHCGKTDPAALWTFIWTRVRTVTIEPPAIINSQLVADRNRIIVRERKVESVPTSNFAQPDERLASIQAREVYAVPAGGKFNVQCALVRGRVKNLHQPDMGALVTKDLHRVNLRARFVIEISRQHYRRGIRPREIPMHEIGRFDAGHRSPR